MRLGRSHHVFFHIGVQFLARLYITVMSGWQPVRSALSLLPFYVVLHIKQFKTPIGKLFSPKLPDRLPR